MLELETQKGKKPKPGDVAAQHPANENTLPQPRGGDYCVCESGLAAPQCCEYPERNALNAPVYAYWNTKSLHAAGDVNVNLEIAQAARQIEQPWLFPAELNFERQKLYFVKITPALLRQSVFLDPARIRASCVVECELDQAAAVADSVQWQASSYIFHSAFCGSTLMTKALDALYQTLPLREPDLLGNIYYQTFIASGANQDLTWLDRGMRLLARRFDAAERSVIKVNDYVNPLIQWVGQRREQTPMLFMYTPVEEFYVACSKAENRKQWLTQRVKSLRKPITALLPQIQDLAWQQDYAAQAAIYWSYNLVLYLTAYQRFADNLISLDFNQLLSSPAACIASCADHLRLFARENIDREQIISRLFGSYSKNEAMHYSPQMRQREILARLNQDPPALQRLQSISAQLLAPYGMTLGQPLPGEWRSDQ